MNPLPPAPVLCRVCGGEMAAGIVLVARLHGSSDFGGDFGEPGTTLSEGPGDGRPRACLKCRRCGHSFIPPRLLFTAH